MAVVSGSASYGGATSGASASATYHVQTADASLPNAQAWSLLATGLVKNATGTGVASIAVGGADYSVPTGAAGGQTLIGDSGTAAAKGLTLKSNASHNKAIDVGIDGNGKAIATFDEGNGAIWFGDTSVYTISQTSRYVPDNAGNGTEYFAFLTGKSGGGMKTVLYLQNRGASAGDDVQVALNPASGGLTPSTICALKAKYNATSTVYEMYLSPGNNAGTPQDIFKCDGAGNVAAGKGSLATNATAGFLYLPSSAGAPTGAPVAFATGMVPCEVDTANSKLMLNIGGVWKSIVAV